MKKDDKLYVRKVLFVSKLGLVLLLGYVVVRTVTLFGHKEKGLAPASALGGDRVYVNQTSEPSVLSLEDYAQVIKRNMFGASGQTDDTDEWASSRNFAHSEGSVSEELGLALFGTISGNPSVARAIIKDLNTGVFDIYGMGQEVAGARIEGIYKDAVIFVLNGERKILRFNAPSSVGSNSNNAKLPSYGTVYEKGETVGAGLEDKRTSVDIQTRIGRVRAMLQEAVVEPYIANGRIEGLMITGLEDIQGAEEFGLKDGDILRAVNGHRLTSKQKAYQVLKKARSQAIIDLELLRGGEIKRLSYALW
jgi:type II secretion system protein C